ncbi:MAG: hypothetical protein OHK0028_23080 [Deltaproteobacteria bacterium]
MTNGHSPGGIGYFLAEMPVNSAESVSREVPREQSQAEEGRSVVSPGSPPAAGTQQHLFPATRSGGQPQQQPDFSPPPRTSWSIDALANGEARSTRRIVPVATAAAKEKQPLVSRKRGYTNRITDPNNPGSVHCDSGGFD